MTSFGGDLYLSGMMSNDIFRVALTTGQDGTTTGEPALIEPSFTAASYYNTGLEAHPYINGLATDGTALYVSDSTNKLIRKIDPTTSNITTIAGKLENYTDGTGENAEFRSPEKLVMNGTDIYVIDENRIRVLDTTTGAVSTLPTTGADYNYINNWTSDGTVIYFSSSEQVYQGGTSTTYYKLYKLSPDGAVSELDLVDGNGAIYTIDSYIGGLASDETDLFISTGSGNSTQLLRIALQTGTVTPYTTVIDTNYSLDFDGSNDYVEVPYAIDSAINPTSYTVSAWAKVEGGSGWRSVITSRSEFGSNDKGYIIYAGDNDTWQFWTGTGTGTNSGGGSWHQINSGVSVYPGGNGWAFLTATYDGTTMKFYVNGVQKGGNLDASAHKNTTEPMRIGAGTEVTAPDYYFNGKIDEVAIWNEALGSAEITALYNSGDGLDAASDSGNYTSEGNLVAYYKMNDGSGNTLTDNEDDGTDYDGTLNNMVTSDGNSVWTDRQRRNE